MPPQAAGCAAQGLALAHADVWTHTAAAQRLPIGGMGALQGAWFSQRLSADLYSSCSMFIIYCEREHADTRFWFIDLIIFYQIYLYNYGGGEV